MSGKVFSKKFVYTFLACFGWAITIILGRIMLKGGENPLNLVFWIVLLALPYWLYIFYKNFEEIKKMPKINWLIVVSMGLISSLAANVVEIFALKYTTALNYSLLIRSVTLFTIIFSFIFLKEKINFKKIILIILIVIGTFLFVAQGQKIVFSTGDILVIIEAMLYSIGNGILTKVATNRMSASAGAAISFLVAVMPITLIGLFKGAISLPQMPILIISFALINIIIITLRFYAYKLATASYITMIYSMTPVFVLFMAIAFLGETIAPIQLFGGALIILSGLLVGKFKI